MMGAEAIAELVRPTDRAAAISGAWPVDVLAFIVDCQARGEACALVAVTHVEGGRVRAPGALMGVAAGGRTTGYISNGCIDADVAAQARQAIAAGAPRQLRYGKDSPFIDLRLPCGGGIDLLVLPDPDPVCVCQAYHALTGRRPARLALGCDGAVTLLPSDGAEGNGSPMPLLPTPRVRIAGLGVEPLALARLAVAAELEVLLQTPDAATAAAAQRAGIAVDRLTTWTSLPPSRDDGRTAVVLMFHDHDWEPTILKQALAGPAFYIGALGSVRTHARRVELLRELGVSDADIARVRGPIGLVSALRDAPLLAISALAEIVAQLPQ